jgi:putative lipoprotein
VRRNDELIESMESAAGQQTDCVDQAGSYVYRLEAYGPAGDSVFQEVTVTVTEGEPQENPLADTQWQLSAMNVDQAPLPNTTITASFATDGTVKGTGGCNDYDGTYIIQGNTLFVGPLASGSESCGDEIDQQEEDYLFALEFADTFEISDNDLIIRDEFGEEVLRFNPQ